jgi:hypothetical protein
MGDFGNMYPLRNSYAKYASITANIALHDTISRDGIFIDAQDASTYHPFIPLFTLDTVSEHLNAYTVLVLHGVHCTLSELVSISSMCSSTSNAWDWAVVELPDNVCRHTCNYSAAVMAHDSMPLSVYNRTAVHEISSLGSVCGSIARLDNVIGDIVLSCTVNMMMPVTGDFSQPPRAVLPWQPHTFNCPATSTRGISRAVVCVPLSVSLANESRVQCISPSEKRCARLRCAASASDMEKYSARSVL